MFDKKTKEFELVSVTERTFLLYAQRYPDRCERGNGNVYRVQKLCSQGFFSKQRNAAFENIIPNENFKSHVL